MMIGAERHITRVVAGEDGQSRFEEGVLMLDQELAAPPAEPLAMTSVAKALGTPQDVMLVAGGSSWAGDEPHPAPARLFWAVLSGAFEVTVSNGASRRFGPGTLVLVEDTSGEGHSSRIVTDDALALVLRLP